MTAPNREFLERMDDGPLMVLAREVLAAVQRRSRLLDECNELCGDVIHENKLYQTSRAHPGMIGIFVPHPLTA
jgi:hypothetical protein